ncbi:SMP-30/gluconolactonase/LRE family protein [Prosthecobacter sp.]|uniref:SMP-30/gluconolactonase/LRE family protein n=1 Tax=Prosthecobacter sp. TaxID=1965333 RepID=UPI003784546E
MFFRSLSCLTFALILASCSSSRSPIVPGAKPKDHGAIGATEGPAWKDGSLYFTDGKHINRLGPDGKTTVFRHNSSNGLLFDKEGRLIACETKNRRVTRTEKDGSITVLADRVENKNFWEIDLIERVLKPQPKTRLAKLLQKSRFNSPNDLCMDSKGRIYFTDPRYGSRAGMEIHELFYVYDFAQKYNFPTTGPPVDPLTKALALRKKLLAESPQLLERFIEGVYRIDAPSQVKRVISGGEGGYILERPNGILISPDDRYLYIADNNNSTHSGSRKLLRYKLDKNGDISGPPTVLFDWKDGRGPDGMKMDSAGRIYVAAGTNKATEFETTRFKAGCYILSPSGRLLDFIPVAPDECCNCAFGGQDGKTLFITSGGHLWSVPLR